VALDRLHADGDGHTPLEEDERAGLRLHYITMRRELDEAESANIADARRRRVPPVERVLDDLYLRALHRQMFGRVWTWAGSYRRTERNLGVAPGQIAPAVYELVANARLWVSHEADDLDRVAARFHHRLVEIHPFPNGNGRHARLATEHLQLALGVEVFTWGARGGTDTAELRSAYIDALRRADRGEGVEALMAFART